MTRKNALRIGFYGATAAVLLYLVLDPYCRQSIFGPTVAGEPLCYWQAAYRRANNPSAKEPVMLKVLNLMGIKPQEPQWHMLGPEGEIAVCITLIDDPCPGVRAMAARNFGFHWTLPGAGPALTQLLDDPEAEVRLEAAYYWWVWESEPAVALPKLAKMLDDPNARCRARAAAAVWHLSNEKPTRALTILRQILSDASLDARREACLQLTWIGKDAVDTLADVVACIRSDPDAYFRQGIIQRLYEFGPASIPYLIAAARDPTPCIRHAAAIALGNCGPPAREAIPALVPLLADTNDAVRDGAAKSLSKIDPERYPDRGGP
jgi:hypothetical protein